MGLAASQARFLNLTARKTNIEYEGQQINQQRTTLSNQSANLYNQMLTLKVPTQPSIDNFTKLQYSFIPPNSVSNATVSSITKAQDGTYTIHYTVTEDVIGFYPCEKDKKILIQYSETKNQYYYSEGAGKFYLTEYDPTHPDPTHKDAYDSLCPVPTDPGEVRPTLYYVNAGTDAMPEYRYFTSKDLNIDTKCTYYTSTTQKETTAGTIAECTLLRDGNNRLISFTDGKGEGTTYTVTSGTVTDQQAYDDAQNQYRYETFLYEQTLGKINAETSVLQAQDKTLELRLKQLDTEHQAIQTEVDSISEVIKKNIESSFKSFNA